jgi:excisionase family DNA binding protein
MPETKAKVCSGSLETALFDLVRRAIRAEVREMSKVDRDEDRLLTIEQAAQTLSVSKDWVYRNAKRFAFTRKVGPKMVRFSETGLQKWLKEKRR